MRLTSHTTTVVFTLLDLLPGRFSEAAPAGEQVTHPMTGVRILPYSARIAFRHAMPGVGYQLLGDTVILEGGVLTKKGVLRTDDRRDSVPYHTSTEDVWPDRVKDIYAQALKVRRGF